VAFDYPADSAAGQAYAARVEAGLSTWAEVGMRAPVTYDEHGHAVHVIADPALWAQADNPDCLAVKPPSATV
jgi:hypothetical protein